MARLVASAAIARMHADSEFNRDMEAAKKEYRTYKHKNRPKDSTSFVSIFNSGDDKSTMNQENSKTSENHADKKSAPSNTNTKTVNKHDKRPKDSTSLGKMKNIFNRGDD